MSNPSSEVSVVGAGPVGLTAALALRARGLPVCVFEAGAADRHRAGSRAIYYHRQTLEHWNSLAEGLGWEVVRQGITWSTKQTFWRGQLVYDRSYPPAPTDQLPAFSALGEIDLERILVDACKEAGVEFAWEHEVDSVETSGNGVVLRTTAGHELHTQFVIAADGLALAVRNALGIGLDGNRSENTFVIVDIAEDPDQPLRLARVFHYEHPAVDGRNVLLVPFAGGWRADLMCRVGDDIAAFEEEVGVRRWVGQVLPERYVDRIQWISTYQFLQVVADSFTDDHRRVLLAGEAAHLFAPFGARGLNSGVPDAISAATAIASSLRSSDSSARHTAVDEFATARRAAAEYNRDAAGVALQHMRANDLRTRIKRRLAAHRARRGSTAGAWLDSAPYGPRARDRKSETIY